MRVTVSSIAAAVVVVVFVDLAFSACPDCKMHGPLQTVDCLRARMRSVAGNSAPLQAALRGLLLRRAVA